MLKYPVVAVDYDGTITIKDNYPNAGELNPLAIHYLKEYKKLGGKLILFTCRTDYALLAAVSACEKAGLYFDAINNDLVQ